MVWIEIVFWIALGSLLYPYFGYPFLLLICSPWIRPRSSQWVDGFTPKVSIVLAAYNEEQHIRQKLMNCLELDYPDDHLEILVGSDGSTDRTNEMVNDFRERGVHLFAISPRRGKMATVTLNAPAMPTSFEGWSADVELHAGDSPPRTNAVRLR